MVLDTVLCCFTDIDRTIAENIMELSSEYKKRPHISEASGQSIVSRYPTLQSSGIPSPGTQDQALDRAHAYQEEPSHGFLHSP